MTKAQLVWLAKSHNLDATGTIPVLERRIAMHNTLRDCELMPDNHKSLAEVMVHVSGLRHQLAKRLALDEIDSSKVKDYYVEEKFDGMRAWLVSYKFEFFAFSRNYTKDLRLNSIANIENIDLTGFPKTEEMSIFDVELYVEHSGIHRLERLGFSVAAFTTHSATKFKVKPIVLDVVKLNGVDVSKLLNVERTEALQRAGLATFTAPRYEGDINALFTNFVHYENKEGLVLKHAYSPYLFGKRDAWYKLKAGYADGANEYTVVIAGMGDKGSGRNAGLVGSIVVNSLDGAPYGEVGTFTDDVRRKLTDLETGTLRKELIGQKIEVKAMELTVDSKLRHPAFIRFLPQE